MNLAGITLVLGVDVVHREELRWTWPTWMRFKPELREMPAVVFYDAGQVTAAQLGFLCEHPNLRLVSWSAPGEWGQRERMLTGFVQVPALEVRTPWYLKLDTDVIATDQREWIKQEWFSPDETGKLPVFVASPWGYTKPPHAMDVLDEWADGLSAFAGTRRLNLPRSPGDSKLRHPRIISWLFFGRADWTREMAALCGADGRLPFPSQDTFLFYCAARLGCRIIREPMARHGWAHKRFRHIKRLATQMGMKPA